MLFSLMWRYDSIFNFSIIYIKKEWEKTFSVSQNSTLKVPRPLSKHSFVANWKGRSFLCITFIMSIYWINKLIMTYKRTQTAQGIMLILSLKDVIAWWTRPPTLFVDIRSMLTTQKPELRINREVFCLFWTISVAFYTRQKGTRPINFCFVCTQLRIVFNFLFHH